MAKLERLFDGIKSVAIGTTFPYIAKTSLRISDEQHSKAMEIDQREHRVQGLFGYTDWINSKNCTMLYCLGMGLSVGLAGGIVNYGLDRFANEHNPTVLLSELGAIVFGNIGSLAYEKLRKRNFHRTREV